VRRKRMKLHIVDIKINILDRIGMLFTGKMSVNIVEDSGVVSHISVSPYETQQAPHKVIVYKVVEGEEDESC
jgi:hypothetical protein